MTVLGRTGIEVGDFVGGAGGIGGFGSSPALRGQGMTAAEGWRQLDAAAARGIRLIDTADAYGGGESERVVGEWRRGRDALLATEVGKPVDGRPGRDAPVATGSGDAGDRRRGDDVPVATEVGNVPDGGGVDLSAAHIRRQIRVSVERLGRVDLDLTHQPDPATPPEETLTALAELVADVRELARHAAAHGVSTAGLALAWLRAHPRVTAAIVAPRTEDQWRAVDEALALDLGDASAQAIGAVFY